MKLNAVQQALKDAAAATAAEGKKIAEPVVADTTMLAANSQSGATA